MTIVKGQIESLKRIRSELNQNGISRFNSIGDINSFKKNFKLERQKIIDQTTNDFYTELEQLKTDSRNYRKEYESLYREESEHLNFRIRHLQSQIELIKSDRTNVFIRVFRFYRIRMLESRKKKLNKNFNDILLEKTLKASEKLLATNLLLKKYISNEDNIITQRSTPKINEISSTKRIVDGLNHLIAGAIGEQLVVNELKKLSDEYILINDFSVSFSRPIYNRKNNDRIFSIQVDHLLVTRAGIFVIETKNWSKESIKNLDLRSPIEQIRRTSYALFVVLNSDSDNLRYLLKDHHWGEKQIPIKSLVVMIKNKPKEKFRFVEVKTLKELNSYIEFFEPVLNANEVKRISNYLEELKCNY